jgi:hypothetical protein
MKDRLLPLILVSLILGLSLQRCTKDDEPDPGNESPASINFLMLGDSIYQTEDSLVVELQLNRKASIDGYVSVKLSGSAVHGQDFTTSPEAVNGILILELHKEMQSAKFTVFRSDPLQVEKTLNLVLENPAEGFQLGNQSASFIKLLKQEPEPAGTINFSDIFIHISESEPNGFEIGLNLSSPITNTEQLFIDVISPEGFSYGTHFFTNPGAIQNELKLEVIPGVTVISFTIFPVEDDQVLGTYEVLFRINTTTGQLQKGAITELVVRVEEDDNEPQVINTIAELRNMFSEFEGEFWLADDYYIEGIITSGSNVIDDKTAYIQDETGGIMLRFTIKNFLKLGDKVRINLGKGSGKYINDQKAITDVHDMLGIKLGENQFVAPEVITLDQLTTGVYEGKRIRINDVSFPGADGNVIFNGNRQISGGSAGAIVTTYSTAPFRNYILPQGKLSLIGIVGDWGHILPQAYSVDIIR